MCRKMKGKNMKELSVNEALEVNGGAGPGLALWGVYLGAMAIGAALGVIK